MSPRIQRVVRQTVGRMRGLVRGLEMRASLAVPDCNHDGPQDDEPARHQVEPLGLDRSRLPSAEVLRIGHHERALRQGKEQTDAASSPVRVQ